MKIMFLNAWGGELIGELEKFVEANRSDIDVFCFMEGEGSAMAGLYQNLSTDFEIHREHKNLNNDGFTQVSLISKGVKVLEVERILADNPSCGFGLHTALELDGHIVNVCNFHGVAWPGSKVDTPGRLAQTQGIIDFYSTKNGPVVIGGDFNLDVDTVSVQNFIKAGYRNLIADYKIDTTRNHYAWDRFPDTPQKYADFVFVSPDIEVQSFSVPKVDVSDHLPQLIDFKVTELALVEANL